MTQRKKRTVVGMFLACLGVMATIVFSQAVISERPELRDFILEKMKADHAPGFAACIVKKDRLVWARGFGWADIEKKVPMTADTI